MKDWSERVRQGAQLVKERVKEAVRAVDAASRAITVSQPERPLAPHEEPPVVARLVIEIRSDGTRTVARGAIEDTVTGERAAVEARGDSPAQLAAALAGNIVTGPLRLGRAAAEVVAARLRGKS